VCAFIFAAVAAAWAVYLLPKALRHQEEPAASRTVEQISDRARVLARRDAISAKATALVAAGRSLGSTANDDETPGRAAKSPAEASDESDETSATAVPGPVPVAVPVAGPASVLSDARLRGRRLAARRAAQRRRRVLVTLLLVAVAVLALAAAGRVAWLWSTAPVVVIVAWLIACRLMVRRDAARRPRRVRKPRTTLAEQQIALEDSAAADDAAPAPDTTPAATAQEPDPVAADSGDRADTDEIAAVVPEPGTWQPVNVPLPTYVDKAPAQRTVRTIDLDATGVWTSGRRAIDSELAREAEAKDRADRAARDTEHDVSKRRASGS